MANNRVTGYAVVSPAPGSHIELGTISYRRRGAESKFLETLPFNSIMIKAMRDKTLNLQSGNFGTKLVIGLKML